MKRIVVVAAVLLLGFTGVLFAQSPSTRSTVGLWVAVENEAFRNRVMSEMTTLLNNTPDWNLEVRPRDWNTDIHVIVSGMAIPGTQAYAWGVTFTPMFAPYWTNGSVATSTANVSGMNWVARQLVEYVISQLYSWYDTVGTPNPNIQEST